MKIYDPKNLDTNHGTDFLQVHTKSKYVNNKSDSRN